nr:hypothetical protein [Tanacetum cinerariifolium]
MMLSQPFIFDIDGRSLEFGREDFYLITGFRFGKIWGLETFFNSIHWWRKDENVIPVVFHGVIGQSLKKQTEVRQEVRVRTEVRRLVDKEEVLHRVVDEEDVKKRVVLAKTIKEQESHSHNVPVSSLDHQSMEGVSHCMNDDQVDKKCNNVPDSFPVGGPEYQYVEGSASVPVLIMLIRILSWLILNSKHRTMKKVLILILFYLHNRILRVPQMQQKTVSVHEGVMSLFCDKKRMDMQWTFPWLQDGHVILMDFWKKLVGRSHTKRGWLSDDANDDWAMASPYLSDILLRYEYPLYYVGGVKYIVPWFAKSVKRELNITSGVITFYDSLGGPPGGVETCHFLLEVDDSSTVALAWRERTIDFYWRYKILKDEIIVLSLDSSDDRKGPSNLSVPIFEGPSVQGLLDHYGYNDIEEYLSWNYFLSTDKDITDKDITDEDCIHESNYAMSKECSSCGALYTRDCSCSKGSVEDKVLVPKPLKNCARCAKCGHPVNGHYCQGCALVREKLEEDLVTYFQNFQDTSESSDDSTKVVNAPREPFVVKHDHGVNPPHIDKCCCECGDALDGIFYQQCICKSCGKGAHTGYNCPPKVPIVSNPEPCNQTMSNELPQTLPSFDPPCYSEKEKLVPCVSKPKFVDKSSKISNPPPQPPIYSCEFCGSNAQYGHYCIPQVPFNNPELGYSQDFNFSQNFHDFQQQYLCCDQCGGPHVTFQCQQVIFHEPCCENCGGPHENFQCQP